MTAHTTEFLQARADKGLFRHLWRKVRRLWRPVLGGLLVIWFIISIIGFGRLLTAVLDLQDDLLKVEEAAAELDWPVAIGATESAQISVQKALEATTLLWPLRLIPFVSSRLQTVQEALGSVHVLLPIIDEALRLGMEIFTTAERSAEAVVWFKELSPQDRRALLSALSRALPELERLQVRLVILEKETAALSALPLPAFVRRAVNPLSDSMPSLSRALEAIIPIATMAPEFGGLNEEKNFFLIFANNTELRPGGGFIGTVGELRVRDGEVISLSTRDIYEIDGPVEKLMTTSPPDAIERYLNVPAWFTRDANWSPDGPEAIKKTLELLAEEEGLLDLDPTVYDGAIVLTPDAVSPFLEVVGPITIDDQTFTAENFAEALGYQIGTGFVEKGLHPTQRKEIIGQLADNLLDRLLASPLSDWRVFGELITQATERRQLYFYSQDSELQEKIERIGWAGSRRPPDAGDAFLVVDANLASLKSNPVVDRTIVYRLRRHEDGRLIAKASIVYDHQGEFDWRTTRYRTYTRLFVPKGSTLLRAAGTLMDDALNNPELLPGPVTISEELGWTSFGAFTAVEPGASRTLEFIYALPDELVQEFHGGLYELTVLKQLGSADSALTVDVDFGKPIISAVPSEAEENFGDSRYLLNTKLDQDAKILVNY